MSSSKTISLDIVTDDREKAPFSFARCKDVESVTVQRLPTGDYGLLSHPSAVAIERKASPAELAGNLFKEYDRFERELERMRTFDEAHVVLCFSVADLLAYPHGSDLPPYVKRKIKINGRLLIGRLLQIQAAYPHVRWWFAGSVTAGRDLTLAILKGAVRREEITDVVADPEPALV